MTPRYIAFILTENWFGQNRAGMGNWHYVGHWANVRNFSRKKSFFQNFNTFFCFENDLSVIFGFLTPKFIKVPLFMKIEWTKLKIWTKMHYQKFPRWPPRGRKREIVIQTFDRKPQKLFEIEPWNLVLLLISWHVHMLQISLKFEKVGFRQVPLWCGISRKPFSRNYSKQFFSVC